MPLIVVPTPIGNLEDITLRALRTLREADVVACEDTRRTGRLLAYYEIRKPLVSHHEHNEGRSASGLAERARNEKVVLVSDAGTPLVSDPGYPLVRACIDAGVDVEVLPGPSAPMTALVASGLPTDVVVFLGFLPRKGRERKQLLERMGREASTFVVYESPHRLSRTLGELPPEAPVAVCRELTKLHEEVFRGTLEEALRRFETAEIRGEIVVVVEGRPEEEQAADAETAALAARSLAEALLAQGMPPSAVAKELRQRMKLARNEAYQIAQEAAGGETE